MDWSRFANIGAVIALIVFILAVVFWAVGGRLDPIHAAFFAALALARLLQ